MQRADTLSGLTFGFEQTFTIPEWWTEPGFVSTSDTPLKRQKMKDLAESLAKVLGGSFVESVDIYNHLQYETFEASGKPSFVVTMDPGSIEVKSPPLFLQDIQKAFEPLFAAADAAGVVAYRNWWYGIRTGTEGGCHVNMAGLSPETNPLFKDPVLLLKYMAFFHNNPWIQYPFMGVDVGPGGNCMRMDEHPSDGTPDSVERFEAMRQRVNDGASIRPQDVTDHFKGTKVAADKHSAPSLYKYKGPDFFIEDRAVEALREPEDFYLVSKLRHQILTVLSQQNQIAALKTFGSEIHRDFLCSTVLWDRFVTMAKELGLDAAPYKRFFERQFPKLFMGESSPSKIRLHEGRRPRVITDVKMRGDLIISKTIDTSFKRFEIHWTDSQAQTLGCLVNGLELKPKTTAAGSAGMGGSSSRENVVLLDCRMQSPQSALNIELRDMQTQKSVELASFHIQNMLFQTPQVVKSPETRPGLGGTFYFNVDNKPDFYPV